MSWSDALENALLDHVFGGGDYTRPGTLHLALYTAAPSDAGGGTEVSGNGYSRVAVTNNPTNFPAASGGAKTNGEDIEFPQASGGAWGTIVAWALHDHATNDSIVFHGAMTPNQAVPENANAKVAAGTLEMTQD